MKVVITSDLHVDVNRNGNFGFRQNLEDVDVLLIAGDIAGSYERELQFFKGLKTDTPNTKVIAVAGNHLGYEYNPMLASYCNEIGTKQWSIDYLKLKLTELDMYYLDNDYLEIDNYIIFGGTMYSDYNITNNKDLAIYSGEQYLNDFRYVYIQDKKIIRRIKATDYIKYHKLFIRKLNKCIKETKKDIIVLSHFAPSINSISSKYLDTGNIHINASYASNMEDYIMQNKRIKYWIHGHCHDSFDYEIGQCRILCQPYGYTHENKMGSKRYMGKVLNV